MTPTLYVARDHASVLARWREEDARDRHVLHVDDHCDLRGLLVDVGAGRAAPSRDALLRKGVVYGGNFLAQAVLEGRLASVRWVYSAAGGRDRDVGTVQYLTDASALPYRLGLRRAAWQRFAFAAMREEEWRGELADGEELDVDWDFFASRLGPPSGIRERARAFLARPLGRTPRAYLAYSAPYSHPSHALFEEFAAALAARLELRLERIDEPERPRSRLSIVKRMRYGIEGFLRRELGVF